jgi:hypothetical protein
MRKKHWTTNLVKGSLMGLLVLGTLGLVACGTSSSDSLRRYSKLQKTLGPAHNAPTSTQTYQRSDLFMIELDPSTPAIFVVGQKNVLRIKTALHLPGTKYQLVSRDLPRGATPFKPIGQGVWEMTWTPNKDLIPRTMTTAPQYSFHVALQILEVTNLQSKSIVDELETEREYTYTLLRSNTVPEIVDIKGVSPYPQVTKLNQGDVINLAVFVKDPSSSATQKPKLSPIAVPNKISDELQIISGHAFVYLEGEPIMVKPDLWQFNLQFDTKNNSVPEFNLNGKSVFSPTILANLTFEVIGASRSLSVEKTLTFEITYRRELMKPTFKANPEHQIVSQNSTWSYTFSAYLPKAIGTLAVFLNDETVKLPGTPKLSCKSNRKESTQQACRIDWKIPCEVTPGDVVLKVTAAAEYQGQNTATELQKALTVKEHRKCVAAKKATLANSSPQTGGSK